MEIKRNKKEYRMNSINGVSLKYGSTNRANPQVLYVTGKAWVKPMRKMDYSDSLNKIRKRMERRILERLRLVDSLETKYVFDFSIPPLNMKVGKPKFMTFSIFLKQSKDKIRNLKSAGKLIDFNIVPLIDEMIKDFNDSDFVLKSKKDEEYQID